MSDKTGTLEIKYHDILSYMGSEDYESDKTEFPFMEERMIRICSYLRDRGFRSFFRFQFQALQAEMGLEGFMEDTEGLQF